VTKIGCNGTVTSLIVASGEGVTTRYRDGSKELSSWRPVESIGDKAREAINERLGWHRDGTKEHGKA